MSEFVFVRNTTMAGSDIATQVVYTLPDYDETATTEQLIASSTQATHISQHPLAAAVKRLKDGKGLGFGLKVKRYLDNDGGMVIGTVSAA